MKLRAIQLGISCAPLLCVAPLAAQHGGHATTPPPDSARMPLYREALGPFARAVTTSSQQAQAYFDQGAQLMFAFTPDEAARSFREAQRHDPRCAMCLWGEAWALGAYLNEPMSPTDAPRATHAAREARRLAQTHGTPVERALTDAMVSRYETEHDAARRKRLDSAYARAMATAYREYAADDDVATLYAEALMLLEPRRGNWDIQNPSVQRIHGILETVLDRNPGHPGACHLYVHATESTERPEKAEACADLLGRSIPGASHINHMPSHTYNRVGRWGDAVRANIQAWHSDQRAEEGKGFAIYPSHNLHMLLFAASMDGQGAVAIQAGKDYAKLVPSGEFYHALTLLRFGRFDEILSLGRRPEPPIERGMWEFARGYAHLREGAVDSARLYGGRVLAAARETPDTVTFRGHPAGLLLGTLGGILDGELERHTGDLGAAINAFERAVAVEDSLRYDEPEPLNLAARHWLGAALLERGHAADAERVYREELADHPHNGWSLFGLAEALRLQGKDAEAGDARAAFERAWSRSDIWLKASRF